MLEEKLKRLKENKEACQPKNKLSEEQKDVVNAILEKNNVIVNAKAGAGKTTVSLEVAKKFHDANDRKALLLTYNKRLKLETQERIKKEGLKLKIDATSYHGAATKFFLKFQKNDYKDNISAPDDQLIIKALEIDDVPKLHYGLIIVDEAQDMTELYCNFVKHLLSKFSSKPVMLIMGDPFQQIYRHLGSSNEYLMNAQNYFAHCLESAQFVYLPMTICWRITQEMAKFINEKLNPNNLAEAYPEWWKTNGERVKKWWGEGIKGNPYKESSLDDVQKIVDYNFSHPQPEIVIKVREMFKEFGNSEAALLSSMMTKKSPLPLLINELSKEKKENWHILGDNKNFEEMEDVIKGKRLASTIHKFKGLERDGIFVSGFDCFLEIKLSKDPNSIPLDHYNLFYVACTRARKRLVYTVHNMPYATIRRGIMTDSVEKPSLVIKDFVQHVPSDIVLTMTSKTFDNKQLHANNPVQCLPQQRKVEGKTEELYEDLSLYYAKAVEYKMAILITGLLPHYQNILEAVKVKTFDGDMISFIRSLEKIDKQKLSYLEIFKYCVAYRTFKTTMLFYWRQMRGFCEKCTSSNFDYFLERSVHNAIELLFQIACRNNMISLKEINCINIDNKLKVLKLLCHFDEPLKFDLQRKWYSSKYNPTITGSCDIILCTEEASVVVNIFVSEKVAQDFFLETEMCDSFERINNNIHKNSYVLIANKAVAHELHFIMLQLCNSVDVYTEFIFRMAHRKMLIPFSPEEIDKEREKSSQN